MRRVMAAERYDITVEQPSKWIVPGLTVIAFVVGLLANTTAHGRTVVAQRRFAIDHRAR
jgi:hypothetical protein